MSSPESPWWKNNALNEWFASGERGISSETIVMNLTGRGRPKYGPDVPCDPSDFRRCELLLREVPLLRLMLPKMAEQGPVWAALVERWDEIVATCEKEVPGCFDGRVEGSAPRAYALIRECRGVAA
jgi:hypothetical protein